ncbi:MAG: hypothetical protein A2383_01990 [Candidatus Pacebacteria bacterium RIFOXYB1_FULL_39_46]|nr:MAG: hypothetical protein A2182_03505 [Candidatus Pacebacteria bacterium RIFOXYA1_FULL_38_18]OGJ37939.1 MAG: hypothetical protein A2383_01990 [Candidatus Pacebacteria bacterium RIFOXYB1_FULL_39_46]OGJ39537.1 MAG: hypothetical protein A2411_02145 [Candidatus Pacebacteria bacterium RIFOXYC1_FULL_39_21]OGJ40118.1 MAG: hypothetical protein A2582_03435 [Candidatus Pacebacteria bacterium RIFOXYD1_FULL_39_27]
MNKQSISIQDFILSFKEVIGKSIWRVIHPADGWLTIDLGQKYTDTLPGKDGQDEPYERGRYQIHITGNWKVYKNGELIESRNVDGDDQKAYFDRMEELAANFPLVTVESVKLNKNHLVIIDKQFEIRVPVAESTDSISLSVVELDANNKPVSYSHYRFDEELGKLASISTK